MSEPHVACAIDVNDFDPDVITTAASFARELGAQLDLIHVTLFPDPSGAAWPAYLGSADTVIQDNRKLKSVEASITGVLVNRHHLSGIPDEKVIGLVNRTKPRLLVMGSHVRNPLARLFLGSIASKILRRVTCPVMIIKMRSSSQEKSENANEEQLSEGTT